MATSFAFKAPRPLALRIWHWLNAVAVLGLLATVLLRKTVFSWRTNSALIESRVQELGGAISPEGAVTLAKALRAPMWEWHYVFGFAVVGLLVVRFAIGLVSAEQSPLRATWRDVTRFLALPAAARGSAVHYVVVRLTYLAFYGVLAFMSVSGLAMYFGDALGLSRDVLGSLKDTHELLMWFFVLFVPLHVLGVVIAELRGERGLVSDMIHGGEPEERASEGRSAA